MRISIDDMHRGSAHKYLIRHATVLLNGSKVEHCIAADEDNGYVIVNVTDNAGSLMLDETGENIVTKTIKGKVVILMDGVS